MAASYLIDYLCCEDIVPSIQQVVEDDQQNECQHYQQQIFKYLNTSEWTVLPQTLTTS